MGTVMRFDERVALEAILYLASRTREPTFQRIAKLFYFADRLHLQRYGRLICGDRYIAMRSGPVPSATFDMLRASRNGATHLQFPALQEAFTSSDDYRVIPRRQADADWLSDSDIECLDEVLEELDTLPYWRLAELSRDAAWQAADERDLISLEAIAATLEDAEALLEYLRDPNP